ncbi:hypothetical protein ACRAWF_21400 [Streptomyces sp. L7]
MADTASGAPPDRQPRSPDTRWSGTRAARSPRRRPCTGLRDGKLDPAGSRIWNGATPWLITPPRRPARPAHRPARQRRDDHLEPGFPLRQRPPQPRSPAHPRA